MNALALVLVLFSASSAQPIPTAPSQPTSPPTAACHLAPTTGAVPREILEKPVGKRKGIGSVHEVVTTKSKEAQAFYDQGAAYLYDYVWIEAARNFHQALRLDPKLAMAHVGLSRVHTALEDKASARASLEKAQAIAAESAIGPREQKRISLRALQVVALENIADPEPFAAYKAALDVALAADPKSVELNLLRGNAEEPLPGGRGQMGGPTSVPYYERVLVLSPGHFGAHHFLIHSYENFGQIDAALKHGALYAKAAPAIPHAQHMYGHDLRRVGRTKEAIAAFEKADKLELAYYASEKIPAELDWHRPHNLGLLALCYQHQGRMKLAEERMRTADAIKPMSEFAEFNRRELPAFLLSRGRNDEALAKADELATASASPAARSAGHVLAGEALLAMKKPDDAAARLELAKKEFAAVGGDYAVIWKYYLPPVVEGLEGQLLLARGKHAEARALLLPVIARARALPGPDAWSAALFQLERLAKLARESGDWELARTVASEMIAHDKAYGGSHFAMAMVLRHEGDEAGAKKALALSKKLWAEADKDLPELKVAAVPLVR